MPQRQPKRKPGGQPGNLNALTHGFYSNALKGAARTTFKVARTLAPDDLAQEIAVLRTQLYQLIDIQPDNVTLLHQALASLARLCATHYHLRGSDADRLTDAMSNILDEIERTLKGDHTQ